MGNNKKNTNGKSSYNLSREYFILPEAEILRKMGTTLNGLSVSEAEKRLNEFGPNIPTVKEKFTFLKDILRRIWNPLVILLFIICAVSFLMGDFRSVIVVSAMIFLSVFLGYIQEQRSVKASEKLQKLVQTSVIVLREDKEVQIPIEEVVPGDIVILAAGSIIPADIRILQAKDFFVNQSILTGESMPVEKFAVVESADKEDLLSFQNACFQGSTVVSGSARGLVLATGLNTMLGTISKNLSTTKEETSFDQGVRSFVWLMVRFMAIMVAVTFLIVGITKGNWTEALLFGLSIAVGLTPEMLPMIMTVCLSKGAIAMSKKKVIVKNLKSIQNFGAMNILCTDKTGTLTQDNIVLEKHLDVAGRESQDVLEYAYMNSYFQTGLRNLLDRAILAHEEIKVEPNARKIDEIPFDFTRKRMSVIIEYNDQHVLICKGAVEDIYCVCDRYQVDEDIFPLIDAVKNALLEDYTELSAQGFRVLAIAYREFDRDKKTFSVNDEQNLILLGYIAFFDPPKDSAKGALAALKKSGVEVKILTGDNELVTRKVCDDVELEIKGVVTGAELSKMNDEEFKNCVRNANVFARLTPAQKEQIIKELQKTGNVVGFMGDGINDAPAMRAADVGISVDTAVDVARESADIILLEKSLMVLEDGIIEGRKVFANIIKYIKMGASSNFGNMFSVVGGSYFLPFLPMTPIQILTNNLLYDVSQIGIPSDEVDNEFVERPRSWDISFIKKFMIFIGPISSFFDYATFILMLYFFNCILFSSPGTSPESKAYYEKLFHTGWFVESLLTQTLIVHIIRTNKIPFFQSRPSHFMLFTTLSVMAVAIFLPYSPLADILGLVPLPAVYWLWIAGFLITYSIITHLVKTWFNKRYGS
jgi:Mg2+-importing ATPase